MFRMSMLAAALLLSAAGAQAADTTADQKALVDLEAAWSKAVVNNDTKFIASIVADDWLGQDSSGKLENKAAVLADSKKARIVSMVNHDVEVRIVGDIAIVQGSDTQKGMDNGKDVTGEYNWMDVWAKRGGKWFAIASQDTKVDAKK